MVMSTTPKVAEPASIDDMRRDLLWIMSHLPRADQAVLVKVAEAMESSRA